MARVYATVISDVNPFSESFSFQKDDSLNTLLRARWRSLWGNFEIVDFHHSTPKEITNLQLAKPYYEKIWETLTLDEQLALYRLARDRFIHVEHPGLDSLFRKGLIRFDPDLCLLNTSFRAFVLEAGDRDRLAHQEATQGESVWDSMKIPVGLGFTIVAGTLILTQEELRAALPAVFAALPFLLQGFSEFTKTIKSTS